MELKDLTVGTLVRMINEKTLNEKFTGVEGGFICNVTSKFLSNDMKTQLIGKDLSIMQITPEDPIMPIMVNGFWIPLEWVDSIAPKPKITRRSAAAANMKAEDGTTFGPVFKKLFSIIPDLGNLSTNRFSMLRADELQFICSKIGISYEDNVIVVAQKIMAKVNEY